MKSELQACLPDSQSQAVLVLLGKRLSFRDFCSAFAASHHSPGQDRATLADEARELVRSAGRADGTLGLVELKRVIALLDSKHGWAPHSSADALRLFAKHDLQRNGSLGVEALTRLISELHGRPSLDVANANSPTLPSRSLTSLPGRSLTSLPGRRSLTLTSEAALARSRSTMGLAHAAAPSQSAHPAGDGLRSAGAGAAAGAGAGAGGALTPFGELVSEPAVRRSQTIGGGTPTPVPVAVTRFRSAPSSAVGEVGGGISGGGGDGTALERRAALSSMLDHDVLSRAAAATGSVGGSSHAGASMPAAASGDVAYDGSHRYAMEGLGASADGGAPTDGGENSFIWDPLTQTYRPTRDPFRLTMAQLRVREQQSVLATGGLPNRRGATDPSRRSGRTARSGRTDGRAASRADGSVPLAELQALRQSGANGGSCGGGGDVGGGGGSAGGAVGGSRAARGDGGSRDAVPPRRRRKGRAKARGERALDGVASELAAAAPEAAGTSLPPGFTMPEFAGGARARACDDSSGVAGLAPHTPPAHPPLCPS